jgi:hemerythrin
MLVEWQDSFNLGIELIDDQHKRLVHYLNELYDSVVAGNTNDVIGPILDGLVDYTIEHFVTEENYQQESGYPGFAEHKAFHDDLTRQVVQLQQQLFDEDIVISYETLEFLQNWLTDHILTQDKKFGVHYHQWLKQ